MKKILLIITGCFISTISFGQNLNLNELVDLQDKNIAEVEEFLTSKGWEFIKAVEPKFQNKRDEKGRTYVTISDASLLFAFDKAQNSNSANAFINYFYRNDQDAQNRIEIQLTNKEKYTELLNEIHNKNAELKDSYVKDESLVKVYQNANTTFKISTSKQETNADSTLYSVFIMNNDLYSNE